MKDEEIKKQNKPKKESKKTNKKSSKKEKPIEAEKQTNEEVLENTPESFQKLVDKVNDYKDKYLRAVAETDNLRKRYEKEKLQSIMFANEKFAGDLLETLDNFENAMSVDMPDDIKQGIDLVYKNLQKTLQKHNVFEVEYDTFNPDYHEAVSKGDGDGIKTVHRKGYMIGDRLLRPAMVSVGE